MTKNQIDYWNLRWKQHYESILAEVKVQELKLEFQKLAETKRHNRVTERQEQQRIILETQDLARKWAELNEKIRAALVSEGLRLREVKVSEALAESNIALNQAKIDQIFDQRQIAFQEFRMSVIEKKNTINQEWLKAEAQAFKNGYLKGGSANLAAELKNMSSTREFEAFEKSLGDLGGWFTETYGPDSVRRYQESKDKYTPQINSNPNSVKDVLQDRIADENAYRSRIGQDKLPDPTKKSKVYIDNGKWTDPSRNNQSNERIIVGITTPSEAVKSTRDVVESRASSGTKLVYSGGSHYGPGYQI